MARTNIAFDQVIAKATERLRSLKHLAIVEIVLRSMIDSIYLSWRIDSMARSRDAEELKRMLLVWQAHLTQVLKDSPSGERKFLRWKLMQCVQYLGTEFVVAAGELEVLPETSL